MNTVDSSVFVYFISAGSTPIKIGVSADPKSRLKELQTAHYQRLHLLYTIECAERNHAYELENAFHRWYEERHLINEWYSLTPKKIAADIHLLTTLAKVFIRVEQHVEPEKVEKLEIRAEKKLSAKGDFIRECSVCHAKFGANTELGAIRSLSAHMKLHVNQERRSHAEDKNLVVQ